MEPSTAKRGVGANPSAQTPVKANEAESPDTAAQPPAVPATVAAQEDPEAALADDQERAETLTKMATYEEASPHPLREAETPTPQSATHHPLATAATSGIAAKRPGRSGRQIIREVNSRVDQGEGSTVAGMVTAVSLNAQYKTIPEEHAEFRARNKVRSSYRGPVYTVEDVSVPCHACGGPVDPVARVPVGSLFFHVNCVECYLCGRRSGVTGLFVQVDRRAICSECAGRGYERWVPRQEAQSRGMVYGAIQGDVYAAMDAHDRGERGLPRIGGSPRPSSRKAGAATSSSFSSAPAAAAVAGAPTLNQATVPGALPPSLTIRSVHNTRNTGRRSFALMERQQYYTQSDHNLLMRAPASSGKASGGDTGERRVNKADKAKNAVACPTTQRIMASKNAA
jgi:hypothetical protein